MNMLRELDGHCGEARGLSSLGDERRVVTDGTNMNAWIDRPISLDAPEDGMSKVHCEPGSLVTLEREEL